MNADKFLDIMREAIADRAFDTGYGLPCDTPENRVRAIDVVLEHVAERLIEVVGVESIFKELEDR